MPASLKNVSSQTPMGANLVPGGCTFRAWAPRAKAVYVQGAFNGWSSVDAGLLVRDPAGYWAGFIPGITDGDQYKFWVIGEGSAGYKRDPYARELSSPPAYPHSNCVVRDSNGFAWHDEGFRPPAFNDLVIYQLHIGTFYAVDNAGNDRRPQGNAATFLDALDRVAYLSALGVNAIEPLPIVEFPTDTSLGYNGVDYFSPEMEYAAAPGGVAPYLTRINDLYEARGHGRPATIANLSSQVGQLKTFVDLCHVYGLAVLFDVVYNHAGGDFGGDQTTAESLYFFDRYQPGSNNNSLYFTDEGVGGGLAFALWNKDATQFLINNAKFWLQESHADGFRYDEVSAIANSGGRNFCQALTGTVRFVKPAGPQIAEYWNWDRAWPVQSANEGGGGFDLAWQDRLRGALRGVIGQATGGAGASLNLDPIHEALYPPPGYSAAWRAVNQLENHDLMWVHHDHVPRIAALADPSTARSWYARSRARVATSLLLTAPGAPMLFMGEEFLEDKNWSDNPKETNCLIWWDGLKSDKSMIDFLRFTQDAIALRRRHPALRAEGLNVFHVHNGNRVLAFQRWVEGVGRDVVVVASLHESTYYGYQVGFPGAGWWHEVFNSDVYDNWVNPIVAGNGTGIWANGPPMHGLPASAGVVIPANGVVIFARDTGD
jgi:1,4-alpha-glucan branching enzyme